jgi:hypothetical protein
VLAWLGPDDLAAIPRVARIACREEQAGARGAGASLGRGVERLLHGAAVKVFAGWTALPDSGNRRDPGAGDRRVATGGSRPAWSHTAQNA